MNPNTLDIYNIIRVLLFSATVDLISIKNAVNFAGTGFPYFSIS